MKKTTIILPFLLVAAFLSAQKVEKVTAWLDVQQIDGRSIISSWCQNHTSSPLSLQYKAMLIDGDSAVNEGTTLALPDQPNLLLNGSFTVEDASFERVELLVYHKANLVAKAFAIGPPPIAFNSQAKEQSNATTIEKLGLDDLEIGRLVLDETRSKLAHDFYELFYGAWTSVEEDIKIDYTINIKELPNNIGIGTRLMVEVDGQELTQLNLQPRVELAEALSMQLVELLYNHFTNPDDSAKEIQTEDISGTGVY